MYTIKNESDVHQPGGFILLFTGSIETEGSNHRRVNKEFNVRKGLPKIIALQRQYQGINFVHLFLVEKPMDVLCFATTSSWDIKDGF